jgi:hypothetical protein
VDLEAGDSAANGSGQQPSLYLMVHQLSLSHSPILQPSGWLVFLAFALGDTNSAPGRGTLTPNMATSVTVELSCRNKVRVQRETSTTTRALRTQVRGNFEDG